MTALILNNPKHVEFYLIDLKAGVEFYKYRNIRQVKEVATNVGEAHDLLTVVMKKLEAQKEYYRDNNWSNVVESPIKTRTFVIIDEAGDLVPEKFMTKQERNMHEECQWLLAHISRIGGAFGFRELFFSQYTTADVLPRQIKQNCDAKICFKIQNEYASEVILGEGNTQAADLPKIRGRAIYKDGADMYELQVPLITDEDMNELLADYYEDEAIGKAGEIDAGDVDGTSDEDFDDFIRPRNTD